MISAILSATTYGVNAFLVTIETHLDTRIPKQFNIVGLPDSAVKESKERFKAAIHNSGFHLPNRSVTINLAPADIRKEGSGFDLPIALGVICESGQLETDKLNDFAFIGELSLEGKLRPIKGILPIALEVKKNNLKGIIVPPENAKEAAMVEGIEVYPIESLTEVVHYLNGH